MTSHVLSLSYGKDSEYTEDVPPGFTGDSFEIITYKPERIKALYERKRKEFDEAQR